LGIFCRISKIQQKHNNLGTKNILPLHRLTIRGQWASIFQKTIALSHPEKAEKLANMKPSKIYEKFPSQQDVVLDRIISITKTVAPPNEKLYDVTVPSTFNFCLANGLGVRDTAM
jgi:hypothetical protein